MKLVFYFLLLANIVVVALGWLDVRSVKWVPEYQMNPGVAKLILLSDSKAELGEAANACWLLGPYSEKDQASILRSGLRHIDYRASLIEKVIPKAPAYWVYFGPLPGEQEARRQLEEFQSKRIDSFIINRAGLTHAISLGVFENIDSATRMQALMRQRGYDTSMTEISKQDLQYWVSLSIPPSEQLNADFEAFLSAQNEALEVRQIFCK